MVLCSLLLVTACATWGIDPPNCFQKAAIAKVAIDKGYGAVLEGTTTAAITVDVTERSLVVLDNANKLTEIAQSRCANSTSIALSDIETVVKSLKELAAVLPNFDYLEIEKSELEKDEANE